MQTSPQRRTPLIASIVVIVVLAGAFGYFYVTSTGTINSLNSSISSQQGVIANQAGTISSQSGNIVNLMATVSEQSGSISNLQANVSAFETLVASLHATISADTVKIANLNASLASDATQIMSLNAQIATANSMMANLTATVNLQVTKTLLSGQSTTIYGTSSTPVAFFTFNPTNAGYVVVSVSGASEGWFPEADYKPSNNNPSGGIYAAFVFLTTSSPAVAYVIIPVVPGTMNSFFLESNTSTSGTATVTLTYYY